MAVGEAIQLAKAFGSTLHVVCAYHPQGVDTRGVPAEFQSAVQPDSTAQAVLDDVQAWARQVGGRPASLRDRRCRRCAINLAAEIDAALIVVGNKGISSVRRYVLGNIPSKVVHHAPCSTYVVHTT